MRTWTLMPGAEVVEVGERRAQIGVPPCVKLWFQRRLPPPTTFVLPDEFFRHGVVQVSLEFFVYHYLFAAGKALGRLPDDHRLVVIGTPDQLRRCKRILEVSLHGFSAEEMRSWDRLSEEDIRFLRLNRAWFSPKRAGFEAPPGRASQAPLG